MSAFAWKRWCVLVVGFGGLSALMLLYEAGTPHTTAQAMVASWLIPIVFDRDHWLMGVEGWMLFSGNVGLLLAHALRPNAVTALMTMVGTLAWFFFGMMIAGAGL